MLQALSYLIIASANTGGEAFYCPTFTNAIIMHVINRPVKIMCTVQLVVHFRNIQLPEAMILL